MFAVLKEEERRYRGPVKFFEGDREIFRNVLQFGHFSTPVSWTVNFFPNLKRREFKIQVPGLGSRRAPRQNEVPGSKQR